MYRRNDGKIKGGRRGRWTVMLTVNVHGVAGLWAVDCACFAQGDRFYEECAQLHAHNNENENKKTMTTFSLGFVWVLQELGRKGHTILDYQTFLWLGLEKLHDQMWTSNNYKKHRHTKQNKK